MAAPRDRRAAPRRRRAPRRARLRRSAGPGAAPRSSAAIENTTSMSCSVNSSVSLRSAAMRSSRRIASRVSAADMPAVGSSSSSSFGSLASAMPSSSCFWLPCESESADRVGLAGEAERGEQRVRFVAVEAFGAAPEIARLAAMRDQRGLHVLEHRELAEDIGVLERAADAHAADRVRRRAGDVAPLRAPRCRRRRADDRSAG